MARVDRLDLSGRDPRLADTAIQVACDVDNPFHGPRGAARVFGPQKGAAPTAVERLDRGLAHLAGVVRATTGVDLQELPGAGAAGGAAGALAALLGAELTPGAPLVLDALGFAARLEGAGLCLTGEGRLDETSVGRQGARGRRGGLRGGRGALRRALRRGGARPGGAAAPRLRGGARHRPRRAPPGRRPRGHRGRPGRGRERPSPASGTRAGRTRPTRGRGLDGRPGAGRPRRATLEAVTERLSPGKDPLLRLPLILIAALALGLAPALAGAAGVTTPADQDIARAQALSSQWGRCPTARPAQAILTLAERTTKPKLRATRARSSVRAWTTVARVCSQPVPQPTVIVS